MKRDASTDMRNAITGKSKMAFKLLSWTFERISSQSGLETGLASKEQVNSIRRYHKI